MTRRASHDHRGNKSSLPSKLCAVCARPMSWRKSWAKNWDQVLYCSEACRRQKSGKVDRNAAPATGPGAGPQHG